jgi:tRNA A-37 threonylcarbamoyl transferase component Bud32/2-polyprenyl-3-methyl-5-hydroxy-6-metoxy-1,4-benzoquinol methylase
LGADALDSGFDKIRRNNCTIYVNKDFRNTTFEQLLTQSPKELRERYAAATIPSSECANVFRLTVKFDGVDREVYFKEYLRGSIVHFIKQLFRTSRAKRAFRATLMLAENDFGAPTIIAMGERKLGFFRTRDFLVTLGVTDSNRIYEFIPTSVTDLARQQWRGKRKLTRAFGRAIGKMHNKGIFHGDLRLGNVLVKQEKDRWQFIFLDNDRTKRFRRLPIRLQVKNLVQVNMKLPNMVTNTDRMRFFKEYWAENGGNRQQKRELVRRVIRRTNRRLDTNRLVRRELRKCLRTDERYLRLVGRDSRSETYPERSRGIRNSTAVFERDFCREAEPVDFIEQIDTLMDGGQILKQDSTSYVSRLTWNGKDIVVKRYNHRGLIHSLRHTIKRSRARRNWLYAHRLGILDIATPRALAYIEQHKGMLVWKSYLVTEHVDGRRLYDILRDNNITQKERSIACQQLTALLGELDKYRITHGDLKHTNILITEAGPMLTDLDAMKAHRLNWTHKIRRARDRARFVRETDTTPRRFGVDDPDLYWQRRKNENRIRERRLHRFLSDLVDEIAAVNGGKVLDCGTGAGHVFRLCMKKHETYGIELSSEAIAAYDFPAHNIKQADLNKGIPDFGIKFDVIIASMVLHWLDDPCKFLRQAKVKLGEQGRLLVVIPNITFYRYRIAYLFGKFPPISLSHKNFQVPAEVEHMFRKSGFNIERRLSPRKSIRARLLPTLFSPDIVYVLKPR